MLCLGSKHEHSGAVVALALLQDGEFLAVAYAMSASTPLQVKLWDTTTLSAAWHCELQSECDWTRDSSSSLLDIACVRLHNGEDRLAVALVDGRIQLCDPSTDTSRVLRVHVDGHESDTLVLQSTSAHATRPWLVVAVTVVEAHSGTSSSFLGVLEVCADERKCRTCLCSRIELISSPLASHLDLQISTRSATHSLPSAIHGPA